MKERNVDQIGRALTESSEDLTIVLKSIANKSRLQLLAALQKGKCTFSELQETSNLGKTALAHHLGILVEAGVLNHPKRGHYELSVDGVKLLNAVCTTYASSRRRRELESTRRAEYIQKVHIKRREKIVKELNVRIVKLEPMRVASVRAISKTPERDAWAQMRAWAEPKGLLENIEQHPVFGFNSPDPSPGNKEYGYEFWIRVGPKEMPEGNIKIKEFKGGLYAVTTCKLKEELESEFFRKEGYLESWKKISDWVKSSKYNFGQHQCLEKAHDPGASDEELILDLYCSITQ